MLNLPFANRVEAGRLLANELSLRHVGADAVVLALARGGVPIGSAISDRLHLPLDVIAVRKVGVPWQPELAMGGIAGSVCVLNNRLIRKLGIWDDDVAEIVAAEQKELQRCEEAFRGGASPLDLHGRPVILVDDGLATGSTMLAAARHVRALKPSKVTIAAPVGAREACEELRREADDLVCLAIPEIFYSVGKWYREFPQVDDAEVQTLLAESRRRLERKLASPTAA
jgi:predicted phosphoribosyltransferase